MDYGHYNCRDYHITPHFAPTTYLSERHPVYRHESFDELEQRSRSPASQKPKFPLLRLPLELRQQILGYLLPYTQEHPEAGHLASRDLPNVRVSRTKDSVVPSSIRQSYTPSGVGNMVWQRGNINLFSVCRQLHRECAELMYGTNTFLLFVTYRTVEFRFRWRLRSGLAPTSRYEILKVMPKKYLQLLKRVVVHVDYVDPYMGMIKFNVQGRGLVVGLRERVRDLMEALQSYEQEGSIPNELVVSGQRRLAKVSIRVSNGSAVGEALKYHIVREDKHDVRISDGAGEVLEPFASLRGVSRANVGGAVSADLAAQLVAIMESEPEDDLQQMKSMARRHHIPAADAQPLCVYGNDMM